MIRIAVALGLGAAAAATTGLLRGEWHYAPAIGWIVAAAAYLLWTWRVVLPLDPEQTRAHVLQRLGDGSRRVSHIVILAASLASLAGVGYLLAAETGRERHTVEALIGILSVVAAWFAIHTTFTLRYAQLYYRAGGGVDFEGGDPSYTDFAYLAFTVGMTYQVSDTTLTSRQIRGAVLSQALVSFVMGAVVLASTINLVLEVAGRRG